MRGWVNHFLAALYISNFLLQPLSGWIILYRWNENSSKYIYHMIITILQGAAAASFRGERVERVSSPFLSLETSWNVFLSSWKQRLWLRDPPLFWWIPTLFVFLSQCQGLELADPSVVVFSPSQAKDTVPSTNLCLCLKWEKKVHLALLQNPVCECESECGYVPVWGYIQGTRMYHDWVPSTESSGRAGHPCWPQVKLARGGAWGCDSPSALILL